jgi:hypothetical protein
MDNIAENRKIEIEHETLRHLNSIRKWTMFLAIFGFIILGLYIVIGVIAGTFFAAFSSGVSNHGISESLIFVLFFVFAAVFFTPLFFLFRFSKFTARAIHTSDKHLLNKAVKNLKSHFIYIGVLVIICILFYIVILVVTGSSVSFIKGLGR